MASDKGLYYILVDKRAEKDLKNVSEYIINRFSMILDEFEVDPINRRPDVNTKRLKISGYFSDTNWWLQGLYSVDKNHIVRVIAVVHRKKAYRVFEDLGPYKTSERTERDP